jgi:predicted transcriptional regulator
LADDVPAFLHKMHEADSHLADPQQLEETDEQQEFTPAVSARRSLASKDHNVSMVDGKPYRTLRRHLAKHGLTPEQYRERYNLKPDYPMVAENLLASPARLGQAHRSRPQAEGRSRGGVAHSQAPQEV